MNSDPAIAGCRKITGYIAVRIFAPMHGPEPSELATPCDVAARHGRVRLRPASSLAVRGRAVLLTHNIDAKLADIAATAARSFRSWRAASARRPGAEIFIRAMRPPASRR